MVKKVARAVWMLGVLILISGAFYMALRHNAYAISSCFAFAAILLVAGMIFGRHSKKKSD